MCQRKGNEENAGEIRDWTEADVFSAVLCLI